MRTPLIGDLRWSNEDEEWVCVAAPGGRHVTFHLGGDDPATPPSAALLDQARRIAQEFDALESAVAALLESTAVGAPPEFAPEIRALRIESVSLYPERPGDGMIYFNGRSDDLRLWRCDYVSGQPRDLVYDD